MAYEQLDILWMLSLPNKKLPRMKNKNVNMVLKRKITKEEIQKMPITTFDGRIIVIQTEEDAIKAVTYLKTFPILGIDSETRPSFNKGQTHKVALLQVSTDDSCFLFRLNMLHINPGAAGIQGFHQVRTLVRFNIGDGDFSDLEVIELSEEKGHNGTATF